MNDGPLNPFTPLTQASAACFGRRVTLHPTSMSNRDPEALEVGGRRAEHCRKIRVRAGDFAGRTSLPLQARRAPRDPGVLNTASRTQGGGGLVDDMTPSYAG